MAELASRLRRVAYLLALISAALYGAGDFVGGLTARRTSTVAVVVVSQLAGLALLIAILPALHSNPPTRGDLLCGVAAGLAGGSAIALLYRALAIGTMAIVAPITASCAVVIPVAFDVAGGAHLRAGTAAGIVLALVAIALVSQGHAAGGGLARRGPPRGVGLAVASGVGIGLFFLALARTSRESGLWPLAAARAASVLLFACVAAGTRTSIAMPRRLLLTVAFGGVLDMLANALYLVASRGGDLSVIVTLASLYPASTVLLARVVLGERLTRLQYAGISCAFVAIVLIVGP